MESTDGETLVVLLGIGGFLLLIVAVAVPLQLRWNRRRRESAETYARGIDAAAASLGHARQSELPPGLAAAGIPVLTGEAPDPGSILGGPSGGVPAWSFDLTVEVATTADSAKDLAGDVLGAVTGGGDDGTDGDRTTTFRLTCAAAEAPVATPATIVAPAALDEVSGSVRLTRVRTEAAEFDRAMRVDTDSPRFASALLDPAMMAWMLDAAPGVAFELAGGWVLAYGLRVEPERRGALLDALAGFIERIPDAAGELGDPDARPKRRRRRP